MQIAESRDNARGFFQKCRPVQKDNDCGSTESINCSIPRQRVASDSMVTSGRKRPCFSTLKKFKSNVKLKIQAMFILHDLVESYKLILW